MAFDPMTGKPIETDGEEIAFDPMTGEPVTRKQMPEPPTDEP